MLSVISNLVGHLLDSRLARFAKMHKCTYSRYADDLTFSTSRKEFPPQLAHLVPGTTTTWQLGDELRQKIVHSGFTINDKKTRMQFRASRQVTTGLMVNEKVNIRQEYWRAARQMAQALFTTGTYYRMVPAALAGGVAGDPPVKQEFTGLATLEGILGHIHRVKNHTELRKEGEKREKPNAARGLYREFLFYKSFVALDRPVIVPEGKTDSIYLRCATRRLTNFHPKLGAISGGKFTSTIRFMNYSATVHDVLDLGRGASPLERFMRGYHKTVAGFRHTSLAYPVIILIDNDDGGKSLFGFVNGKTKIAISFKSSDLFYYLGGNLYLVKTPETPVAPHMSCMETFFEQSVLDTVLYGKTFDPAKEHDASGKYGKQVFATRVIEANAATIDFSGFVPLLERFVAVIDHYAGLKAAAAPPVAVAVAAS